jgi:hypothetical protein
VASEYDPLFSRPDDAADDDAPADGAAAGMGAVRRSFELAARPFVSSPWVWLAWAVLLPGAALATPGIYRRFGPSGPLFLWSIAILLGGLVELAGLKRRGALGARTPLAAWALRVQGNLSLVGLALSVVLVWVGESELLPGLWLLLLGHSFFTLGGLAFRPMRTAGVLFQVGGAIALWPGSSPLGAFAAASAAGCLWMAWGIFGRDHGPR